MKSKNISFAQVLKNKSRSPQLPPKNSNSRLIDLLERWQQCPQEDFTLYLGSMDPIQRSQYSTSRMFCSNNRREGEQFDSWIQKQSTIAPSKEYKTAQSQRQNKNQFYQFPQSSTNINFSSKSKESNKGSRSIADQVRRNDTLHIENSSQYSNLGANIQMIKSKTCENQNINLKSPNNRPKAEYQKQDMQITSIQRQDNYAGLNDKKRQKPQQNKSSLSFKNVNEVNSKKQDIQQIIDSTANIHYQIADLAKKYLTEEEECSEEIQPKFNSVKKLSREEEQQQELLIDNSDKKPLGDQMNDEPMFSEEYAQKIRKTEEMERIRKEEAKNMIKNLMKDNFSKHSRKVMQFIPPKELKMDILEEEQPIIKIVPNNISVGYSFASNHPQNSTKFEFQPKQNYQYAKQIKSQIQKGGNQNESDAQFMRKYIKNEENATPTESIQNIQSIQYQIHRSYRQEQAKVDENIPNTSFQTKFMRTQNERSHSNSLAFLKKGDNQSYEEKKETNQVKVDASFPKVEYFGEAKAVYTQELSKFPHQKIKIVSSSKNRFGSNKSSNKSSPAQKSNEALTPAEPQKQVKTQPFVPLPEGTLTIEKPYSDAKSPEQQKQIVRQGLSPFKTIKEVKNSIVNPSKSPQQQMERINSPVPESNLSKFEVISKGEERKPTLTDFVSQKYEMPKNDQNAYEPSYTSDYNQPSYGKTTIQAGYTYYKTGSNNSNYVTSPSSYAVPTSTIQPYSSTFTTTDNSTIQYLNGYGVKQQASPTVIQLKQKYTSKYTVISNPAFQTCQKFDALISQSRKQFPELGQTEKQIIPPSYQTKPIVGKRSYLTELDIKQSINIDEMKKRENVLQCKQNRQKQSMSVLNNKEIPSLFNKSISNSLKQSINMKGSGQFNFDF